MDNLTASSGHYTRFQERRAEFNLAVKRLREALDQPNNEFIRDACIQRFEFTYELAWNALKDYLRTKDIDVRNAKDTLKAAFQQGLIQDGDAWSNLHQHRNLTSHTYDSELAIDVYAYLKQEGLKLFQDLAKTLEPL